MDFLLTPENQEEGNTLSLGIAATKVKGTFQLNLEWGGKYNLRGARSKERGRDPHLIRAVDYSKKGGTQFTQYNIPGKS